MVLTSPVSGSTKTTVQVYDRNRYNTKVINALIWAVAIGLPLGFVVKRIITLYVTSRVLETRVSWALIPSEEFDVTVETIEHVVEQLGGAYPWWSYWAFRQAAAIRVRLINAEGQLLYVWEAPRSISSVIHTVAGIYEVEIVPLEEALQRLRDAETA